MKKYMIVLLILLASLFGSPLFAGEGSSSGGASSSSGTETTVEKINHQIDVFVANLSRFTEQLCHIKLNIQSESCDDATDLEFIYNVQILTAACMKNLDSSRSITNKTQLLRNLQTITEALRALSNVMKDRSDYCCCCVSSITNAFFNGHLYDNVLALILGIRPQERDEVDDDFMHELMVRAARLPECAEWASDCETNYYNQHSLGFEIVDEPGYVDNAILFVGQLADFLNIMIKRLEVAEIG